MFIFWIAVGIAIGGMVGSLVTGLLCANHVAQSDARADRLSGALTELRQIKESENRAVVASYLRDCVNRDSRGRFATRPKVQG